ncbi:hypothetical protein WJX74_003118 [Apatococcus lobatus]|uniref:Uncharacterized protein n=1 Tax=Apatococcus lobatus TaxID=904363 RepID=A0AAW1QM68_9CHLO
MIWRASASEHGAAFPRPPQLCPALFSPSLWQLKWFSSGGLERAPLQAPIPSSAEIKGDELATAKFVRVAAILVVFAVGITTLPKLGQATTDHAVALLTNPKPFWQKSGAARIKSLATSESAVDRMLKADVAQKLVAALSAEPSSDVAHEILGAMDAIAQAENGRAALQQAGALVSLQAMYQQGASDQHGDSVRSVLYKLTH